MTPSRTRTSPRCAAAPVPSTMKPPVTSKFPMGIHSTLAVTMPPKAIDIAGIRADTVGCERGTHLDNAGSSLPPRAVTAAVIAHLRREEEVGGYAAEAERHS